MCLFALWEQRCAWCVAKREKYKMQRFSKPLRAVRPCPPTIAFILSGQGMCKRKTAYLWELPNGRTVTTFANRGEITSAAFSPQSNWLLYGTEERGDPGAGGAQGGSLRLWDIKRAKELRLFKSSFRVGAVAFAPDG